MLGWFGVAELLALVMLGSLILYALLAGADFGGGVWDLLATGSRAREQRKLIEAAIAPVWEANHVWLILLIVVMFTAFPPAFAAASTALHVPITLLLIGIVLRGSAFVFRQYGEGDRASTRRWSLIFAISSTVTPIFLGITLGAATSGIADIDPTMSASLFAWVDTFPIAVGAFSLALFAFLAAVYLTIEAPTHALQDDFRRRAFVSAAAVAIGAIVTWLTAGPGTDAFAQRLFHSWWTWPLQLSGGGVAACALIALYRRRYHAARVFAIAQVSLIDRRAHV